MDGRKRIAEVRGRKNLRGLAEDLGGTVDDAVLWLGEALDVLTPYVRRYRTTYSLVFCRINTVTLSPRRS